MALSDFLRQAADAYFETGHPRAQTLKPHLESAADQAVHAEPNAITSPGQLAAALSAPDAHDLAGAIEKIGAQLQWRRAEPLQAHPGTRDRHGYVLLVGNSGLAHSEVISFGLYFQAAGTVYPSHLHAAEELYFVVSGTAQWQKGSGEFALRPPGSLIHHISMEPHAMTTGDAPLVAVWAWLGDLDPSTYRMGDIAWD